MKVGEYHAETQTGYMNIMGNIQKIRYSRKLTQDQVIAKMNLMGIQISKSTYAKLETNRMNIKVSELVAMPQRKSLNVSLIVSLKS